MARAKPTKMQKAAIDKLVELKGTSVSRAMRESAIPYSPKTAKNPQILTESVGGKAYLKECGLTKEFITKSLVEDIEKKPQNRLGEMRLGAEILNMTDDEEKEKTIPVININFGFINTQHKPSSQANSGLGEMVG